MNYRLTNLFLHEGIVTKENSVYNGQTYMWVSAQLYIEKRGANPARLPAFFFMQTDDCKPYKKYCEPVPNQPGLFKVNEVSLQKDITDGKALDQFGLPCDLLHVSDVFAITLPTAEPMVRLDNTGKPVLSKNNDIIPVTSITLHLMKIRDDNTGEMVWSEEPETAKNNILQRSYAPYSKYSNTPKTQMAAAPADPAPAAPAAETDAERKARLEAELAALNAK